MLRDLLLNQFTHLIVHILCVAMNRVMELCAKVHAMLHNLSEARAAFEAAQLSEMIAGRQLDRHAHGGVRARKRRGTKTGEGKTRSSELTPKRNLFTGFDKFCTCRLQK